MNRSSIGHTSVVASLILSILCFVKFEPRVPEPGLDNSWRYAIDYASAHHIPFGRALVFTFGPLVSLYSDFHVPQHDGFYLFFKIVTTMGLWCGFLLAAEENRRPYLPLLPVFLANLVVNDAACFAMPFTQGLAASRRSSPTILWFAAMGFLAAVDGLLPLIKGTMSVPVAFCTALAALSLLRARSIWGLIVPALTAASLGMAWVASGQSPSDLASYFRQQASIASGYSDAMSVFGPPSDIAVYIVLGLILLAVLVLTGGRRAITRSLALLCVLFVAFKAAFVRHDGHAVIAASTLGLVGYLLFLQDRSRTAYASLIFGLFGWVTIAQVHILMNPAVGWARFADGLVSSYRGLSMRVLYPDRLFSPFEAAKEGIKAQAALPPTSEPSDVYSFEQSLLLASDIPWNGRPVPQGYSAYTPELAALNAAHLAGDAAPAKVFFEVESIDDRYPNLDDGLSWPALLSHYDLQAFADPFVVLARRAAAHSASIGEPVLQGAFPFDTEIVLPPGVDDVWATFDFHPLRTGRLASLLFKRPLLSIVVTYRDGTERTYRMIGGIGAGGFLLSPTVTSARDFMALKAGDDGLLARNGVRSFRLHQGSTYPFWGTSFGLKLAALSIPPDHGADAELYGTSVAGPPLAGLPEGSECWIDVVGDHEIGDVPIALKQPSLQVLGWAVMSSRDKVQSEGVRLALTAENGDTFYSRATRSPRPDVAAFFHMNATAPVGYSSLVDLRGLHGLFKIQVVQDGPDGPLVCQSKTVDIDL